VEFLAVFALVRGDVSACPVLYDGEAQAGLLSGFESRGLQVERVAAL
jgi:hypothetical protein